MTSLNRYAACFMAGLLSSVSTIFFVMPIRNVSLLVVCFVVILLTLWYQRFFLSIKGLRRLPKWKQRLSLVFSLIFSLLFLVSIKGEQTYLSDNSLLTVACVYIGTYFMINCFVLWVMLAFLRVEVKSASEFMNKPSGWKPLVYALPHLAVWTVYLIAFFPGVMSRDSMDQWAQTETGMFNDWHPVMHTLFIMLLRHIWDSPAAVALAQIVIMALIFGYCMTQFEKAGIRKSVIWAITLLLAVSPVNGIYSITLWKDVLYSAFLFLFCTIIFNLVVTDGEWLKRKLNMSLFFLSAFGLVFFRHNGFPVFIVMGIILLFAFRRQFKRIAVLCGLIAMLHYTVTGPVFDYLKVTPSDPNEMLSIPTQQLARVIALNGNITKKQAEYLNKILPLPLWKQYYRPYTTDHIKFSKEYNRQAIFPDHVSTYLRTWWDICLQNPKLAAEAFIKQTSLVWQINPPNNNYYSLTYMTFIFHNPFGITSTVISQPLTFAINKYLSVSNDTFKLIIWRPATYTFFMILFAFIAFLRNDWKAWLVPLAVLLNTAVVFIALPAQDFRYLYANSIVCFITFLFAFISYRKKVTLP